MTDHEAEARPRRFADQRGIALQTVIIMVVLLAIAGTVAAVLFSRASDVTGELEAQDVTATRIDTEVECERHSMGNKTGDWTGSGPYKCTWTATNAAEDDQVTNGRCLLVGGTFTGPSGTNKCVLTVSA